MTGLRNLLLSGGAGSHDFDALAAEIGSMFTADQMRTEIASEPAELADRLADRGAGPDLLTVFALRWTMHAGHDDQDRLRWGFSPDEATRTAILDHVTRGGGLLAIHTAAVCFDDWPGWGDLLGAAWSWGESSHGPVADALVEPTGCRHPITDAIAPFTVTDEIYQHLAARPGLEPLLTSRRDGRDEPVLWARHHGLGRVVVDTLGHDVASLRHPTHVTLLRRSARWAVNRTVNPPTQPEPTRDRRR